MSEPRRLRELYQDDVFGAALRAADRDAPEAGADAELLAALGVTASVAATTTAAGGASVAAKVGSSAFVVKFVVGSIIVVSGAIGAAVVGTSTFGTRESQNHDEVRRAISPTKPRPAFAREPIAEAAPAISSEQAVIAAPPASAPAAAVRAVERAKLKAAEAKPATALATNLPARPEASTPEASTPEASTPEASTPEASTPEASTIGPELREIEGARALLAADRASEALAAVNAYQRAFPRGALGEEAVAIRLNALVRLGQRSAAEDEAREFLAHHPESPQAPRIRALLGR